MRRKRSFRATENPIEDTIPLLIALAGAATVGVSIYVSNQEKDQHNAVGRGMPWFKGW